MADIFDWPAELRPQGVEWGLLHSQVLGESVFDGSVQASPLGAPRWFFTIETGVLHPTEVPLWEAFIDRLFGSVHRARCWDWRREQPLGVATGTPLVKTSAAGNTLATKGWTVSTTNILKRGSYFGVAGELKRLTVDASSNGSGDATLTFTPPLRAAPAVDVPLVLVKPTALFICRTLEPSMRQDGARHPGAGYRFEEVFA